MTTKQEDLDALANQLFKIAYPESDWVYQSTATHLTFVRLAQFYIDQRQEAVRVALARAGEVSSSERLADEWAEGYALGRYSQRSGEGFIQGSRRNPHLPS